MVKVIPANISTQTYKLDIRKIYGGITEREKKEKEIDEVFLRNSERAKKVNDVLDVIYFSPTNRERLTKF